MQVKWNIADCFSVFMRPEASLSLFVFPGHDPLLMSRSCWCEFRLSSKRCKQCLYCFPSTELCFYFWTCTFSLWRFNYRWLMDVIFHFFQEALTWHPALYKHETKTKTENIYLKVYELLIDAIILVLSHSAEEGDLIFYFIYLLTWKCLRFCL